jgi:L-alanine-DL-glutamate epimerase-like enolase superfamily enzyme
MRIVDIRERTVPIASDIRNAVIDFSEMTVSVLAIITDEVRDGRPVIGFGFNSNGRYAQGGLLRERFIPRLNRAAPESLLDPERGTIDPFAIWQTVMRNEKPGGHGERAVAVGIIDMAAWDLAAKLTEQPLHRYLAERFGNAPAREQVSVYAAGGYYYPGKDDEQLRREMSGYLELGYSVVKMKIAGAPLADDVRRIEAVLDVLDGDGSALAVDANGRLGQAEALEYANALAPYRLRWFEEPGDPLDFALNAEVAINYEPPLATGENLLSMADARNLVRYGGLRADRDVLQMDPALSYGLVEYLRTLDMLRAAGWSAERCIPHGGHQFNLAIAAGLHLGGCESYPGVFAPFGGFSDDAPIRTGIVGLSESPGIGMEDKAGLWAILDDVVA